MRSTRWDRPRVERWIVALVAAVLLTAWLLPTPGAQAAAVAAPDLGTATSFSVLAGTTVTNTGPTIVEHDLGVSPGSAVVGFPPGTVTPPAVIHTDAVSLQAQNDLTTAYNDVATRPTSALTGAELGGLTLQGGVYAATAAPAGPLQVTGTLTLDGAGDPSSVWIFQTGSTLTTGSDSVVSLINGASACNVFWQVNSSATLGTRTTFLGNLMALTSITLQDAVVFHGRALARNGAVTLINDRFASPDCAAAGTTTSSTAPTASTTAAPTSSTSTSTTVPAAATTTSVAASGGGSTSTTPIDRSLTGVDGPGSGGSAGAAELTTGSPTGPGRSNPTPRVPTIPHTGQGLRWPLFLATSALGLGAIGVGLGRHRREIALRGRSSTSSGT